MKWRLGLVEAAAALAVACGPAAGPKASETPSPDAYASPKVCAGCHAEIAKTYWLTGMGRSISRPTPDNRVEDFSRRNTVAHRASGNTYRMAARGEEIFQRREPDFEVRADFIIGSGNHARSYLWRNREGKLVELPVSWYAEKGGYWEMSPGYERADQQDFRRVVPDECLFCHSSYAEPLQAIDCQRCHGPGRAHAESGGKAAIVNPKRLSRERQLEVCMQCHLETTSSPLPNAIRRFQRTAFSYRPGEPLGDFMLHFDHAPGTGRDDKFEIAHAAYRLRKSACFQKSEMTCSTCHDPHRVQRAGEAARCAQCHEGAHHAESTCISCHMPKRRAEDAVHVVMTDHFIRRKPSADRRTQTGPYQGPVALYYPERLPPSAENEAYLAVAQVQDGSNLEEGIPRLEKAIARLAPAQPDFYFELGKAYSKKGDETSAARWFEEALRADREFRPAIRALAASLISLKRYDRAAEVLAAVKEPDARMLTNHGQALLESGRMEEGAGVLRRAVEVNPDLAETHDLLGLAHVHRGEPAPAEREFREAIRLRPDLASAHANLASLLAGRKELAQAQHHFLKALAADPNAVETRRNYGYLLILTGDYGLARAEFEAAARLDATRPEAYADLAELDLAQGRRSAAAARYREALGRAPDFAEANLGLGLLLLEEGKAAEARRHLEKAAAGGDPEARRRAMEALSAAR